MANTLGVPPTRHGPSHTHVHPDQNEQTARQDTVGKPGGFKNDPDDPTTPNEAIERQRRKLRP